jgi:hypothetical protein
LRREKRAGAPLPNMDSHFIDQSRRSLDIRSIEKLLLELDAAI